MRKLLGKPHEFNGAGENFMTPRVVSYYRCGKYAVELSAGEGFKHEPIWGVTVKTAGVTIETEYELSKMFHSLGAAMDHIANLPGADLP